MYVVLDLVSPHSTFRNGDYKDKDIIRSNGVILILCNFIYFCFLF